MRRLLGEVFIRGAFISLNHYVYAAFIGGQRLKEEPQTLRILHSS